MLIIGVNVAKYTFIGIWKHSQIMSYKYVRDLQEMGPRCKWADNYSLFTGHWLETAGRVDSESVQTEGQGRQHNMGKRDDHWACPR